MKITLSEEIYDAIIAAIIQGEIHSDSVVTEALLMERFHVSKSPIRESLTIGLRFYTDIRLPVRSPEAGGCPWIRLNRMSVVRSIRAPASI